MAISDSTALQQFGRTLSKLMYDRLVTGPNAGTRKAEAELLKALVHEKSDVAIDGTIDLEYQHEH